MARVRLRTALLTPVIWAAIITHTVWAMLLLLPDHLAVHATPVHGIVEACGGSVYIAAVALLLVSLAAGLSFAQRGLWKVGLILPQQMALGISAAAGVRAAVFSHYADGVNRPWEFILADQFTTITMFGAHTMTVIVIFLIVRAQGYITPDDDNGHV